MPQFTISGYGGPTFGESYPPLEYSDPVFEYTVNVTKVKGSHSIRAGVDLKRLHFNHHEHFPDSFTFSGGVTALNGGASPTPYNSVADFLLGLPQAMTNSYLNEMILIREWDFDLYARDQWQMTHKLTVNYGLRWEHYPVPTSPNGSIAFNNLQIDPNSPTLEICGQGGVRAERDKLRLARCGHRQPLSTPCAAGDRTRERGPTAPGQDARPIRT